jgi:site-specific DNA recombinase
MTDTKLRFAPLIRVSSENQEKRGESLRTQKTSVQRAVEQMGGVIPDHCWIYSGQEHATSEYEKKRFDQLLKDAGKNLFDCIIVDDPSRWSRDNVRSGQGLEILKKHGVRFFSGQMEHDLFDPTAAMFIDMCTVMNQYHARIQSYKCVTNRIHMMKRGIPAVGKFPFGRKFNKVTQQWEVDAEKKKKIVFAAEQYLKGGKTISQIAKSVNMSQSNLWKVLSDKAGAEWIVKFKVPKFKIDESITLTVPRLLSEETLQKIRVKAKANQTVFHSEIKYKYFLSRMIFCSVCGHALTGCTDNKNKNNRYYRHSRLPTACTPAYSLRTDLIDPEVMTQIFRVLGDSQGLEQAMQRAIPDASKVKELRKRKTFLEKELSRTEIRKNRVIDSIADGIISKDEAAAKIQEIRYQETSFQQDINLIIPQLQDVPSEKQIGRKARLIKRQLFEYFDSPSRFAKMTFDEKRGLIKSFFDGKDANGQRLGVYVEKVNGGFKYEIRGIFGDYITGAVDPDGHNINKIPISPNFPNL